MKFNKNIIIASRVVSMVFTPFYLPTLGLLALFSFSYLSLLPFQYKAIVIAIVYFFTILLPTLLIHVYRRHQHWNLIELGQRERRMVPYVLSILCYFTCVYIMRSLHIPHFMSSIVVAALCIQIICAIVNGWWKISTHTAAIGGVVGALVAFAAIFGFNPLPWLCITIIIAGILGTSRMILRQHSLSEVVSGFLVGVFVGWIVLVI
ncbi:phosphatase PAP2 family protein [Prevotella sp. P2-180]|uniref:phosphatase PAP2 family protein n=1 Tax=Prevotella sp. P2-180 TaxID=2024224 RepID=UPI000B973A41|nr:phosphatase PAP2 family protein [Prevotella sp. P2-180]MCI6337576.1 hypothetical protein [Prevotella sp.]MCI7255857.1 hypothetical protein [Prevotella sp.]MDD5784585.1 hypothetical protein [Prevotella sp.]MDD6862292.1 hypothetical protein [Prevotella sp.]MDD7225016.1 hypothetical protein [Prevotella sp.]